MDAGNPILNTLSKLLQPFSQHARNQQIAAYNCILVSIIKPHCCKQLPVGFLHAEKMAEVFLLNVFIIGFLAFLFR